MLMKNGDFITYLLMLIRRTILSVTQSINCHHAQILISALNKVFLTSESNREKIKVF